MRFVHNTADTAGGCEHQDSERSAVADLGDGVESREREDYSSSRMLHFQTSGFNPSEEVRLSWSSFSNRIGVFLIAVNGYCHAYLT